MLNNNDLGVFNPTIVTPTFGPFDPPIGPCNTRTFSYEICPVDGQVCVGQNFSVDINFVFKPGDAPCPGLTIPFIFVVIPNVNVIEESGTEFVIESTNDKIKITHLNNENNSELYTVEIFNLHGSLIKSYNLYNTENIINTDYLASGKYFGTIKKNGNAVSTFIYTKIK